MTTWTAWRGFWHKKSKRKKYRTDVHFALYFFYVSWYTMSRAIDKTTVAQNM